MQQIKWLDDHIEVTPPKSYKKISGTYFPTVLGVDPWKTPFEAWCKNTRTYEKPFAGNKYTNAGEIIEPKVFEFLRTSLGFGKRLATPADVYGKDYFKTTRGDFFPKQTIFSGMWDALIMDDTQKPEYVVEVKTVQVDGRSGSLEERWKDGEAPHYQALQAALYAYLLGIDKVLMVSVSLEDKKGDYEHPEQVVPSFANGNVYIDEFKISERYPNFDLYIEQATKWWNDHVLTGNSPAYDEKKDAEILTELRTNSINPTSDISALVAEMEQLKEEIEKISATFAETEKRYKNLSEQIKTYALKQFREGDNKVVINGSKYSFSLSKSVTTEIDKKSLENDGLLDKYTIQKINHRLTTSKIKEEN